MNRILLPAAAGLSLLALAGCAAMGETDTTTPPPAAGTCDATPMAAFVGRVATPAVIEEARIASGATIVRTVRPGEAITLEFRADRLTLRLDASDQITEATCA